MDARLASERLRHGREGIQNACSILWTRRSVEKHRVRADEEDLRYAFDGIYEPGDVARYLAVTLPWRTRPLTGRRVFRWIRGALVAPERRDTSGWVMTIDFQDLVSYQVIT